jgi:hypothetical protein
MAISIDTVYQKVLAFANKEQRGYITPQEFNLFADQAQKEIFEQYFYDLNQFKRLPGNDGEYSDIISIIKDKISFFEFWAVQDNITVLNSFGDVNLESDIPDLYRLGEISVSYPGVTGSSICEQITPKEFATSSKSKLTAQTKSRPVFVKYNNGYNRIKIYPYPVNDDGSSITIPTMVNVRADYTRKPATPKWGYFVVGDKALYDSSSAKTTDFELHPSEETELVYKILKFAGLSMQRNDIAQGGQGLESLQTQQEKQ